MTNAALRDSHSVKSSKSSHIAVAAFTDAHFFIASIWKRDFAKRWATDHEASFEPIAFRH